MHKTIKATVDGKEIELQVHEPTTKILMDANIVYNKKFYELVKSGIPAQSVLDKTLQEQGLWTEKEENQLAELMTQIALLERKIRSGGKLSEAKENALKLKNLRMELRDLILQRTSYMNQSADGMAEQYRFAFLMYKCVKYHNGQEFFSSVDHYLEYPSQDWVIEAAKVLSDMVYGNTMDVDKTLIENRFFEKFGMENEKFSIRDNLVWTPPEEEKDPLEGVEFIDDTKKTKKTKKRKQKQKQTEGE